MIQTKKKITMSLVSTTLQYASESIQASHCNIFPTVAHKLLQIK